MRERMWLLSYTLLHPRGELLTLPQHWLWCSYELLLNDAVSNSTVGILQGFSVVIRTRELAQSVYTLTTPQGTLQVHHAVKSAQGPSPHAHSQPSVKAGDGPCIFDPT